MDTTGTIWPERQRLLAELGFGAEAGDADSRKSFDMNWKMTAKTILVQLHHKIETFEHFNKHLVLVIQDRLLDYMKREFRFDHLNEARLGDSMQVHAYRLRHSDARLRIELVQRLSTDAQGIALCLGLQAEARMELEAVITSLEHKISANTLLTLGQFVAPPVQQMPSE